MKTKHIAAFGLSGLLLLAGCSKDEKTPEKLSDKTYFGMNEIEVEFNGSAMSGKRATLKMESGDKATITFDGAFDLSTLSEDFKGFPPLATAGVLPGSPSLTVDAKLTPGDGKWTFSGSGDTDYVTYSYTGAATPELMSLVLSDVKLKNQILAGGVWAPEKGSGDALSADQAFHIVWELALPLPLPGIEAGLQELLRALVNYPFIPVYGGTAEMSLTQVLVNGLKTLAFTESGNLVATYMQTANGAATYAKAPLTMLQYVPLTDSMLKLFINPTDVLSVILLNNTNRDPNIPENPFGKPSRAEASDNGSASQIDPAVIMAAVKQAAEMLAGGIPMNCPHTDSEMQLYLGTELLLPLMQNVLLPILTDPSFREGIMEYVAEDDTLKDYAAEIELALDAIPLVISQTKTIEFGLNLQAAK